MSGTRAVSASTANASQGDWLIAGVALRAPNNAIGAIPVPESIAFLYRLPRRRLNELDPRNSDCPICLKKFRTDGPSDDVDIFRERHEIPLVLPCSHIIGSRCAYKLYSPFKHSKNSCPLCRTEFFPKESLSPENPAVVERALRLLDWMIQESSRRLVDGPEDGKQDARNRIEHILAVRATYEAALEEMRTGRRPDRAVLIRTSIQEILSVARHIQRLDEEIQMLDQYQDEQHRHLAELQAQEQGEWARLAGIVETLRDNRTRLRANVERIRERIRGQWARNMRLVASLREQRTQISNEISTIGETEATTLREMATALDGEGPNDGAERLTEEVQGPNEVGEEAERQNEEVR